MGPLLTSYPPRVGCYVDGVRGLYMVDAIVAIAEASGFEAKDCDKSMDEWCPRCHDGQHTAGDGSYTEWVMCQFASEVEDEATKYMNANLAIENCYWGHENGDWGLWPTDYEEDGQE